MVLVYYMWLLCLVWRYICMLQWIVKQINKNMKMRNTCSLRWNWWYAIWHYTIWWYRIGYMIIVLAIRLASRISHQCIVKFSPFISRSTNNSSALYMSYWLSNRNSRYLPIWRTIKGIILILFSIWSRSINIIANRLFIKFDLYSL